MAITVGEGGKRALNHVAFDEDPPDKRQSAAFAKQAIVANLSTGQNKSLAAHRYIEPYDKSISSLFNSKILDSDGVMLPSSHANKSPLS